MKQIAKIVAFGVALVVAGCVAGVPQSARVVGGGLKINYEPEVPGTAILVEKATGKVVVTESLNGTSPFRFDAGTEHDATIIQAALGIMPTNAHFVLYYVTKNNGRTRE